MALLQSLFNYAKLNHKKVLIILTILLVLTTSISLIYRFYIPKTVKNYFSDSIEISNYGITIDYIDDANILINETIKTLTKKITIKNLDSNCQEYSLNFNNVKNTISNPNNFKYSYVCTSTGEPCVSEEMINLPVLDEYLKEGISIASGVTHTYEITFILDVIDSSEFFSSNIGVKKNWKMLRTYNADDFFWKRKEEITSITFENKINIPTEIIENNKWDMSLEKDGGIMAYVIDDGLRNNTYKLYIQSDQNILANYNSEKLFAYFHNLTTINNLSFLITSKVTNMSGMFFGDSLLTTLDLSNFNTSNVTDMNNMFWGLKLTNLELSSFNTSRVIDMNYMFRECDRLASLDLSSFDTSNVNNMDSMFGGCRNLTILDVSKFNTKNVTNMHQMFSECHKLKSLNLTKFNTNNVINIGSMFAECDSLTSLDLSSFNTEKITGMFQLFSGCVSLQSINMKNMTYKNLTSYESMFFRIKSGVKITVKDAVAKKFVEARLFDSYAKGTVTIAI